MEPFSAVVERSPTKLKVQGSNPSWSGQRPANETVQNETTVQVGLRVTQNVNTLCVHHLYGEPVMAQR